MCMFYNNSVQLLQTLSISASGKREKLLRVIKNPVTQYLPVNARKVGEHISMIQLKVCIIFFAKILQSSLTLESFVSGFSSKGKLVEMQDYVASIDDDTPLVFVVIYDKFCKFISVFHKVSYIMSGFPSGWCDGTW